VGSSDPQTSESIIEDAEAETLQPAGCWLGDLDRQEDMRGEYTSRIERKLFSLHYTTSLYWHCLPVYRLLDKRTLCFALTVGVVSLADI
jgi:hypothetical protein